jgi:hypothetical protein
MKDAYKQDKAVLYTALSKIMRTDNARKEWSIWFLNQM